MTTTNTTLTKQTLTDTITKTGVTSVTALWHALGHQSKINGSKAKQIRTLVPNIDALFAKNAKTPTTPKVTVATPTPPVETKAKKVKVEKTQRARIHGFYADRMYGMLVAGAKEAVDRQSLIASVAKQSGKTEQQVTFAFYVLKNPKHKTNNNRVRGVEENGKVQFVPVTA